MASVADVFRVLAALCEDRVIEEYAVGGAMAMLFWAEPVLSCGLDVVVPFRAVDRPGRSVAPASEWLRARGQVESAEHVTCHGTPVQFLASPNPLGDEAIAGAAQLELEGVPVRVMRPE